MTTQIDMKALEAGAQYLERTIEELNTEATELSYAQGQLQDLAYRMLKLHQEYALNARAHKDLAEYGRLKYANLPKVEKEAQRERQSGKCAICEGWGKEVSSLVVDHSHETGFVRGLLCGRCNNLLGGLESTHPSRSLSQAEVIGRAILYLARGGCWGQPLKWLQDQSAALSVAIQNHHPLHDRAHPND